MLIKYEYYINKFAYINNKKRIHTKVRIILNKHDSNLICMIHTCKV